LHRMGEKKSARFLFHCLQVIWIFIPTSYKPITVLLWRAEVNVNEAHDKFTWSSTSNF
jgi:hypothetical protein